MSSSSDPALPAPGERRDLRARVARDRLSRLLGIEPGELRRISAMEAEAVIEAILSDPERRPTEPV